MNSIIARLFSSPRAAALATALALLGVCAAHAQAKPETQKQAAPTSAYADPEVAGSVTEPQGEGYVAPQKLNPKLARVTLYRPAQGFAPGVAHLEVNGHYHTSLQLGGYTEVCIEPADFQLAAHMVQTGGELKNFQDATTTLKPQAAQNLYVRVFEYGDGRATLTPVKPDIAQAELKDTRRQIHAATRVAEAKECVEPEPRPAPAPRIVKKESIVLSADALFAFGKADVKGTSTALTWSGSTLTINPTANLLTGTGYYVKVATTAVKDLAGNPYAGITDTTTFNFSFMNADGSITPTATASVGGQVSGVGDVNGDGYDDFTIGNRYLVLGSAEQLSGLTATNLADGSGKGYPGIGHRHSGQ